MRDVTPSAARPDGPILVVGAGPAGATAARTLAAAGVTVYLLDRSKFPRNKPCGGGISLRALPRFPYLEPALGRIATHRVSRLALEGPDGDSTILRRVSMTRRSMREGVGGASFVALSACSAAMAAARDEGSWAAVPATVLIRIAVATNARVQILVLITQILRDVPSALARAAKAPCRQWLGRKRLSNR